MEPQVNPLLKLSPINNGGFLVQRALILRLVTKSQYNKQPFLQVLVPGSSTVLK